MLRIHLLQQLYSLSDPAMEEALIDVPNIRRLAAIGLISDLARLRLDRGGEHRHAHPQGRAEDQAMPVPREHLHHATIPPTPDPPAVEH